jgi:DNA-binding MarR family transcriptional regulator
MSDVMEKDVREIKYRVDGIEKGMDLLLRANRKQILEDLMAFFGKSEERVKVFLAINGEKPVNQIVQELKIKGPNVSRRISELEREGLIRVKRIVGHSKIYEQTEKVSILNLRKELQKKFGGLTPSIPISKEPGTENIEEQEQG